MTLSARESHSSIAILFKWIFRIYGTSHDTFASAELILYYRVKLELIV